MQEGSGQKEIELGEVSARAFRVVLRHLYTAEVPAWGEEKGAREDVGGGGASGRGGKGGKGKAKGKVGWGGRGQPHHAHPCCGTCCPRLCRSA